MVQEAEVVVKKHCGSCGKETPHIIVQGDGRRKSLECARCMDVPIRSYTASLETATAFLNPATA